MKKMIKTCVAAAVVAACQYGGALATSGWTEHPSNPVYSPGHKAYYETIVEEGGTFSMWYAATAGLKLTTSTDGVNWGPATDCTGLTNANHPLVEKIGDSYRMWYWPGLSYSINDIRTATSNDGITWTSDQPITQVGSTVIDNSSSSNWNRGSYGPADVIYNPGGSATIVEPVDEASVWANKFVMYYDGTTGGSETIGLAVSNDGIHWHGYNGGVAPVLAGSGIPDSWDRTYVSRCTVIRENDDAYHMWYSGGDGHMDYGIGYAFSTDGINWTRDPCNPIFHKDDGVAWRSDRTYCPMVIGNEMWLSGRDGSGVYTIGYAVLMPVTVWVDSHWSGTGEGEYVAPGKVFGENAFATIQDGIDGVANGGTVIVHEGTGDYAGVISITKPGLTIKAGSNPVIDVASGVGIEVHDTAPDTVIDGINFIDNSGGGVAIQNGSSNSSWDGGTGLEVKNCSFEVAQAIDGFADDFYFHDNVCTNSDWNDVFGEGDNPVIVHNTLTDANQSSILLWECVGGIVADNVISGSGTTLYAGTDFGGGISVVQATGLSITANMITNLVDGAAIGFQWDGDADVTISGNVLDTSKLAGIHFGEDSDDDLTFWLSNNLYIGGGAMLDFRPSVGSNWKVDLNYELTLSQADQGATTGNSVSLLRPKTSDDVGWEINFSGSSYTVDTDSDGTGDASYTGFLGDSTYTVPPANPDHTYPDPGWVVGTTRDDITWTDDAFNNYGLNGAPDAETGAPIVNHDPWPSWTPDIPDADDEYTYGGNLQGSHYAFSSSFDPLMGDPGIPDNTWSVTYWDQGEFETPSQWYQRVYTGTINPASITVMAWRGDGAGGVKDMLHHRAVLIETGGNWIFPSHAEDFYLDPNTWLDPPGAPENPDSTFLLDTVGYEVDGTTGFPNKWIIEAQLVPNENILSLESRANAVPGAQIVVQPGGTVDVFLYVQKLDQQVNGCQVYLGFNAGMLNLNPVDIKAAGDVSLASPWVTLVYADVIGDAADAAVGLQLEPAPSYSTQDDATVARLRFTADTVEGTTRVFFKKNDGIHETFMTGYPNSNTVVPSRIDGEPIVIDGTDPVVEVTSIVPDPTSTGTVTITVTVTDALSGVVGMPTVNVTPNGGSAENISGTGTEVSPGVFEYTYTVTGATNNGVAVVDASATDYAGNTGSGSGTFFIDTVDPNVAVTSVKQGGSGVCATCDCTPPAIQGVVDIEITATDAAPSSGLATFPVVTVTDAASNPMTVTGPVSVVGDVYTYQVTVFATTANGTATITADVCDNAGNCALQATGSFCINKTTITATVEHEGMITTPPKVRGITFIFTDGAGDPDAPGSSVTILGTVAVPVTFDTDSEPAPDGNGEGVALLTAIPVGTTHISAKAANHTLRSKVSVTIDPVDAQNTASFMDDDMLLGGDLSNDNKINLTDYSILATNYGLTTDVGDINGSGIVNLTDYMILADNYFKIGDFK